MGPDSRVLGQKSRQQAAQYHNVYEQPSMNLPIMNAANHMIPLQNNNHMHLPHMPQSFVGLGPQNPVYPFQGQPVTQQNAPQMNFSPLQGQILAQGIMNLLQQPNMQNMNMNMNMSNMNMNMPNMNMVNGQFCAPYPVQNMNQQIPMQMPNPSVVVPYGMRPGPGPVPMFGYPNQMPQAMVPQNPIFSPNPQMGLVSGNQVRPPVNQNEKNANAFSPQQSQRNDNFASLNPNSVTMSQGNPNGNVQTYAPHSNWKGSPNQNFKNKPNGEGFQGGFQKSKFHDINNGKNKSGFHKEQRGKGPKNRMSGHFGSDSMEHKQEPKRSSPVTYTEQEIQQWREARRKNHPSNNNIDKSKHLKDSKVVDRVVLQKELKEVLAKQAELGVEVAEIPSYYLNDAKNQAHQGEGKNTFRGKRKFENKFKKKSNRNGRFGKKQKFADKDFSNSPSINKREPTLLQKLLSTDIEKDKSHLIQVFRFMVINSFFQDFPDKQLKYPSVVVKEIGAEGVTEEKHLHTRKDVLGQGDEKTVLVSQINDNCHDIEDEESDEDENYSVEHEEDGQIISD